jgi:MYXO-CTERM domain-containing protein
LGYRFLTMLRFRRRLRVVSSRPLAAALTALLALTVSARAHANGRFPAANQLVYAPDDPSFLVLRTTFGVLFSHDQGANWDWICEGAEEAGVGVGYGGAQDPTIGMMPSSIIVGAFEGLAVSPDRGCAWSFSFTEHVTDVVVRPDNPHAAYALTSAYSATGDAGEQLFDTRVYSTTDDGAHWTRIAATINPEILAETIEVAATDPHRIYISGVKTDLSTFDSGQQSLAVTLVSKDDGKTYAEYTFPLSAQIERAPFIAAVDPKNADRVYVRVKGTKGSRLVVSDNGGVSYRTVLEAQGDLLGFALSPDGAKVYTGGPADYLLVGSSTELKFTEQAHIQVQCLRTQGATLYACSNEASGFIVGSSTDDGVTFAPLLHLPCLRGPLTCSATSAAGRCAPGFAPLAQSLREGSTVSCSAPSEAGAGAEPVDVDAGAPPQTTGGSESSGCSASPGSASAVGGALTALGACAAFFARKRRRR